MVHFIKCDINVCSKQNEYIFMSIIVLSCILYFCHKIHTIVTNIIYTLKIQYFFCKFSHNKSHFSFFLCYNINIRYNYFKFIHNFMNCIYNNIMFHSFQYFHSCNEISQISEINLNKRR